MTYKIIQGSPGEALYTPYGICYDFFRCRDPEVIIAGPAETGKTLVSLWKLHLAACKYPGANIVISRLKLTDIYPTVLQTWKNKVIKDAPVVPYGGENKPQWYDYPNGSRVWMLGLLSPQDDKEISSKVLSGEFDLFYVNQAEGIPLSIWETLTTRTTGRAGGMPYSQVLGDCNPAAPTHWIMSRSRSGHLTRFDSTHTDNPTLWDESTQAWTDQGEQTRLRLSRLTGSRLQRLFYGKWIAPEGAIYGAFDEVKHKIETVDLPRVWPRIVGVDPKGAYTAAVWLAFDPKTSVLHVYREYYRPFGETTRQHGANILSATGGEYVIAWVVGQPAERQERVDLSSAGIPAIAPPIKEVWSGIDKVNELIRDDLIVIHDCCINLLSEIGDYRRKMKHGQATDQIENKDQYHLLDALRYAIVWLTYSSPGLQIVYKPETIGGTY